VGYAFVDDTDLVVSKPEMSATEAHRSMQCSLTAWEGGIRATGGAIVPEKSHWYLVEFGWKDGLPFYQPVQKSPGSLSVKDAEGNPRLLRQLEPWEAVRTLGVRLAPDGNMTTQFEHMMAQASLWADSLRGGFLPRHLTWTAWRTTISKTLEYPLPVTTLSRDQCKRITSVVAAAALPRCGVMRSFPRALLHGPIQYGGLNIPDLYVEQGIQHITRLIRYSQSRKHSTAILLRHSCEHFKVQMGCNGYIFSIPLSLDVLATRGWVSHTWKFVQEVGVQIRDDIKDFVPPRANDKLLVPLFGLLGFRGQELLHLNMCRLFLRVLWLSELTTADGLSLERHAVQPPFLISCRRQCHFPKQGDPPKEAWATWLRALRRLCHSDHQFKLKERLGPWSDKNAIRWWYEPRSQRLYDSDSPKIKEFHLTRRSSTRASNTIFTEIGVASCLPLDVQPATVYQDHSTRLTGIGILGNSFVSTHDGPAWVLENIQFPPDVIQYQNESVVAVSDGSFKLGHGTAAWTLYFSESCNCVGRLVVPGRSQDQSAYRSELAGLYAIAISIRCLEQLFGVVGSVTVGCDGLSALQQVSKSIDFIDPATPQYDLILATRSIVQSSKWNWKWQHVKGHQDETTSVSNLDLLSRLNVNMDHEAKQYWAQTVGTTSDVNIEGEPWQVRIEGYKVTSQLRDCLRNHVLSQRVLDYWGKKSRFKGNSVKDLDWEVFGAAMKSVPAGMQRWISKTTSGFCATGVMMHRRKERSTPECPRCGMREDVEHIWRCTHDTADLWQKSLESLKHWLSEHRTHPELQDTIIRGLNGWRTGNGVPLTSQVPWIQEVLTKQYKCGWRNFFEGFIVNEWRTAQDQFYSRIRSRHSSKRWLSALIRKMWQIAWDLWEHRNGYLHNRENSIISIEVNQNIISQFDLGSQHLDRPTRALFSRGCAAILRKPLDIRIAWLRRVQAARDHLAAESQACYQAERKIMSQWLGRT
jgi:hypothetical protein